MVSEVGWTNFSTQSRSPSRETYLKTGENGSSILNCMYCLGQLLEER